MFSSKHTELIEEGRRLIAMDVLETKEEDGGVFIDDDGDALG